MNSLDRSQDAPSALDGYLAFLWCLIALFFVGAAVGWVLNLAFGLDLEDDHARVVAGGHVLVDVLANDHVGGSPVVEIESAPDAVWVTVTESGLLVDVSDYRGDGDFDIRYGVNARDPESDRNSTGSARLKVHVDARDAGSASNG